MVIFNNKGYFIMIIKNQLIDYQLVINNLE